MFISLKDLLPRSIDKRGLKRTFDAAYICEIMRKILKESWGDDVTVSVRPFSYKNHILYLEAQNCGWAFRVQTKRHLLLQQIKKRIPELCIKAVVVKRTSLRSNFVDNVPLSA